MQQLLSSLSTEDKTVRLRALSLIGGFGDVLWDKPPDWDPAYTQLMKEAPDNSAVKALVQSRVIPEVMKLTKSKDKKLQDEALVAAANLQVPEVIPQLLELAKNKSDFSNIADVALGSYRVFAATPQLAVLLKDSDPEVRKNVLDSLQVIQDKRSLPYIIQAFIETADDNDVESLYSAVKTLYYITGEKPIVAYKLFQDNQETRQQFINFWKQWAAKHKDELAYLRSEVNG